MILRTICPLFGDAQPIFITFVCCTPKDIPQLKDLINDREQYKYHITGPEALSFSQAAEIISQEINRNISYIEITEEDARKRMKEMGMGDWLSDAMVEQFYSIRAGYASQTTTLVEEITGRKPISFSQFVKDYVQAFK